MTHDEQTESTIRTYAARLRRGLGGLQSGEVDDIVTEIRGHIAERVESSADPVAAVAGVLQALGNPEELASKYLTEAVLARGRTSYSPPTLLRAAQRWAMEGLFGLCTFLVAVFGYGVAVSLVLVGALKLFVPRHVGLWWNPPDLLALGYVNGPPDPRFELLGWWIIPLGIVGGCLLWLGMSRLLRVLLRRFRVFHSPLSESS